MSALEGIVLLPLGGVSMGARAWRVVRARGAAGPLHLTIVVKATVSLDDEGRSRLAEPVAVVDDPASADDDLAPHLGKAEIWVARNATAMRVTSNILRLAVGRGSWVMLEHRVVVEGVSIDPQRTAAGHQDPDLWSSGRGQEALSTLTRAAFDRPPMEPDAQGILEIPADVDWTHLFAVPAEQRCRHLQGDEWILLSGVGFTWRCQLPVLRGAARVFGTGRPERGEPIDLACDGVEIDLEDRRCTIRWRGAIPIPQAAALADMRIAGAVSIGDDVFDWAAARGETDPPTVRKHRDSLPDQGGAEEASPDMESDPLPSGALDTVVSSSAVRLRKEMGVPAKKGSSAGARAAAERLAMSDSDAELVRAKLGIPAKKGGAPSTPRALPSEPESPPKPSAIPAAAPRREKERGGAKTALQVGGGDPSKTQPQGGVAVGARTHGGLPARAQPDSDRRPGSDTDVIEDGDTE